ncbi:TRAP transporter substrate-binding protein [Massilia solisilvae]|uniref:TRAP transporter substrate-binding protein n=1 Tax=Massilia solisilvae TaxID=1811225 RepID=A0ABT2BKT6_9BURK|nr:TRAP transporter substrate-binding protein [Massilia solisilvae]MCS0609124.1 TRAP transporter substrate-binding protein [Massilia solisilvae]
MKIAGKAVFGALLLTSAQAVLAQQTILKVHHFLGPNSNVQENLIQPWCNKINKESANRLKCQIYPAMQLGGAPTQLFDQVKDGVVDIVWTVPTYQAGRFTKTEVFELPYMMDSAEKSSPALWEYVQKNALDEFRGTRPIFMHFNDGLPLHMGSKKVGKLEDFKGVKVRAATRIGARTLSALGAIPIQMPAPQVPEAMSKGVVDGVMMSWEAGTSMKIQEVAKVHVETPANSPKMSTIVFGFLMNQAKYDALPADLKKVIDQNSGVETSRWAGRVTDVTIEGGHKVAQERKNTIITLSPEENERWVKACANVDDEWVKEVSAKGANGKALLEDAKKLIAKYR